MFNFATSFWLWVFVAHPVSPSAKTCLGLNVGIKPVGILRAFMKGVLAAPAGLQGPCGVEQL